MSLNNVVTPPIKRNNIVIPQESFLIVTKLPLIAKGFFQNDKLRTPNLKPGHNSSRFACNLF